LICQQNNINQNNEIIKEYINQQIKMLLVYSKFVRIDTKGKSST